LRRVAFFVVPSFVAFIAIGDVLVAGLYRAGEFNDADVRIVWLILIGYSAGLLASTTTRVYQSAFFALRDTVTPARAAIVRVLVALVVGATLMVQFEPVTVFGVAIPAGSLASFDALGLPLGIRNSTILRPPNNERLAPACASSLQSNERPGS